MTQPIQIIGSFVSPYVRKVLVCLEHKGLSYEVDPIVPFYGNDEFARLSPLRRIPVLIDGEVVLSDSTVICEYLDEKYPSPPLMPKTAEQRARARWLEEFADTRMGEVFIWKYFHQFVTRRAVWGEKTDDAVVKKALEEEIPSILDYLESQSPKSDFIFGGVTTCDIALASFFRNMAFAKWTIDPQRWPLATAYVNRVFALEAFVKLRPFEDLSARTPIAQCRAALKEIGAPISEKSFAMDKPVRGVMSI